MPENTETISDQEPRRRNRRTIYALSALFAVIALAAVGVGVARMIAPSGPLAPNFTLTDQHGKPFTLSNQRGRAIAVFFGYTHCPDVCPTTLAALAHAKKRMGAAGNDISVVFVTVDPQRDTPAVMGHYVHLFDPSFIGLSGTGPQLAPVYKAYHVYHQDLPEHGALGYLVAHSSVIDFIGRDGRIRGTGDWGDTTTELATEMRQSES